MISNLAGSCFVPAWDNKGRNLSLSQQILSANVLATFLLLCQLEYASDIEVQNLGRAARRCILES